MVGDADRNIGDIGDYLFNKMVDPNWGLAPAPETAIKPKPPSDRAYGDDYRFGRFRRGGDGQRGRG